MRALLVDRVTAAWAVLALAALASFALGVEGGHHDGHPLRSAVIIVIALFKVRLVGLYFMEIRTAPARLRAPFEAYCLLCCAALLGLFLIHS